MEALTTNCGEIDIAYHVYMLTQGRDSRLGGTRLFSSTVLTFFQYACRTVRPDFRRLPIGIYIEKHMIYNAIIVVMF